RLQGVGESGEVTFAATGGRVRISGAVRRGATAQPQEPRQVSGGLGDRGVFVKRSAWQVGRQPVPQPLLDTGEGVGIAAEIEVALLVIDLPLLQTEGLGDRGTDLAAQ